MAKLVVFPVGGGFVQMRCEDHAPEQVKLWLHFDDPPGFLHVEEVTAEEAKARCVACLAELIAQGWVTAAAGKATPGDEICEQA